jgi:protein-ribulosamine 3-kinase
MDVATAPPAEEFCTKLAAIYRDSKSPTEKFGYHVQTYDGKMAHTVDWQENWAEFYRSLFLGVCKLDQWTNEPWPEMERASAQIADKVIPRLLGILQEDGRQIEPAIIHGDLLEGSMGINTKVCV